MEVSIYISAHFKISRSMERGKMRELQLQTPQRDQNSANHRLKSSSDLNKNLRKVTKKNLNPAFKAVSEDDSAVFQSLKEFSEVPDENLFEESAENFIALVNPVDIHLPETVPISNLTSPSLSSSSVITSEKPGAINSTETKCRNPEVDSLNKLESVEAEAVMKHLREARIQVLKSKDVGHSKKLLDALITIIIEEYYGGLYKETEWLDKLLSSKVSLVFTSFLMGIFSIFMFWFFNSSTKGFINGPTPT